MVIKGGKAFAWQLCALALRIARWLAYLLGRRRQVDVIIYKVDRLGDWIMAESSIAWIVAAERERGGTVVVWASQETVALRACREPGCSVETIVFEPRGLWAKLRRASSVVRLLSVYRARTLICLRHSPEPVRDFVLLQADAADVRALSWHIDRGPLGSVPHEIVRHHAILSGVGLAPANIRDLLPALDGRSREPSRRVIVAPFSSKPMKDWTEAGWSGVVSRIGNDGFAFELWVSSDQSEKAEKLACQIIARSGVANVMVRIGTLTELREAVATAVLVLTVDTFAAHLAVALDVPTVCLLGGGQYGDFAPWQRSGRQRWVSNSLPCFGCGWQCSRTRVECLEDLSTERVVAEIEAVLRADSENTEALAVSNLNHAEKG